MSDGNGVPKTSEPHWFWRVFGGTLLSLVGLLFVTLYSLNQSRISDLQNDSMKLYQQQGTLVKQEEFNNKLSNIWSQLRELGALKERIAALDKELKRQADRDMSLEKEVQTLRERLAAVEGKTDRSTNPTGGCAEEGVRLCFCFTIRKPASTMPQAGRSRLGFVFLRTSTKGKFCQRRSLHPTRISGTETFSSTPGGCHS